VPGVSLPDIHDYAPPNYSSRPLIPPDRGEGPKAAKAKDEVTSLRERFATLRGVTQHYQQARKKLSMYDHAHLGTAWGLIGDMERLLTRLSDTRRDAPREWRHPPKPAQVNWDAPRRGRRRRRMSSCS
jgi:hypothetical protein